MPKLIFIILAFCLILIPSAGMDRHEDFLLYVLIAVFELFAVVLLFKRISLPVYLVIPVSIFSGLTFATLFWVLSAKLGMQTAGPSQQQEIASYLLMIGFALAPASHVVVRYSDYQIAKRYWVLVINGIFSLVCCIFAMGYWL